MEDDCRTPATADTAAGMTEHTLALDVVMQSIFLLRGQKILLDADLAARYGVATKRLNEQVRRNANRFPADFMFQLTAPEFENLRSQIATSNCHAQRRGGRRYRPLAFTEHGAIIVDTPAPATPKPSA